MFCANCGKEIKEGMNFCSSCGSKIELVNKEEAINDNVNNAENNANIDIKEEKKKTIRLIIAYIPHLIFTLV